MNKDRNQGKVHAVSRTERKIKLLRLVKIEEKASEVNKERKEDKAVDKDRKRKEKPPAACFLRPNLQSLTGGIKLTMALGCRTGPSGYTGWRAGTTTVMFWCGSDLNQGSLN